MRGDGQRVPMGVDWPEWADLTDPDEREHGRQFSVPWSRTRSELTEAMRRLGADEWTLDRAQGNTDFPGVVVRWRTDDTDYAVCCDGYRERSSNLRETYLWIEETRKRNDRLVKSGADEFAAAALPAGDDDADRLPPAHEILEVAPDASEAVVRASFREKSKRAHGDTGGDAVDEHNVDVLKRARNELLE